MFNGKNLILISGLLLLTQAPLSLLDAAQSGGRGSGGRGGDSQDARDAQRKVVEAVANTPNHPHAQAAQAALAMPPGKAAGDARRTVLADVAKSDAQHAQAATTALAMEDGQGGGRGDGMRESMAYSVGIGKLSLAIAGKLGVEGIDKLATPNDFALPALSGAGLGGQGWGKRREERSGKVQAAQTAVNDLESELKPAEYAQLTHVRDILLGLMPRQGGNDQEGTQGGQDWQTARVARTAQLKRSVSLLEAIARHIGVEDTVIKAILDEVETNKQPQPGKTNDASAAQ